MSELYSRRMKNLCLIGISVLLLESVILFASYFFADGVSGIYLIISAALPLAIIPFFIHVFRVSKRKAVKPFKEDKTNIINILETIEQAIIIIDAQGMVESLNEAAANMFGYLQSEVKGNKVTMLMPDIVYMPYGSSFDLFLRNIGQENTVDVFKVTGRHSSGDTFSLILSARKVNLEVKPLFILFLHEESKLEMTEKIKDEFISTISHEMRTPLTSILGALGIVSGGMAGEIPEEAKKIIDIAHRNCQGLIALVNDILDISRLESDIHEYRLRSVRLLPILTQAVEDLQPYADQYNVRLQKAKMTDEVIVMGREEQLKQVMTNLVSNAIKYSPADDTVEISLERNDGSVKVSVTDHGPGVPEEFRARIFQKFAQADSSDSRNRGGTGLGLNISRKIIEKHGGRIDYDTKPWNATTFYFELPEVQEEAPVISVTFDEVTGLMAREGFDRELDKEWRRGGRARSYISLIFLEVDDISMYEEMYGSDSQADCMKRISDTISKTLKRAGDVVARYNNNTFAILLADTDPKGCVFVAEKIRSTINDMYIEFALPKRSGHITLSQGIASVVPERMTTSDQFVEKARNALQKALAAGGDVVFYDE